MATRPVTELDKSEVLSGLFAVWDSIDALLGGLSETEWQAATPLPGWCVRAVVSHIIGTESFLQGIAPPQPDIDVKTLKHVRNDIGALNECWVRHLSGEPGAGVLERFRAITNDRRTALAGMSDEEWNAVMPTPVGPESYGRFMRVRTFDCWMHEQDMREALSRPSSDDELDVLGTGGAHGTPPGKPGELQPVEPDRRRRFLAAEVVDHLGAAVDADADAAGQRAGQFEQDP